MFKKLKEKAKEATETTKEIATKVAESEAAKTTKSSLEKGGRVGATTIDSGISKAQDVLDRPEVTVVQKAVRKTGKAAAVIIDETIEEARETPLAKKTKELISITSQEMKKKTREATERITEKAREVSENMQSEFIDEDE